MYYSTHYKLLNCAVERSNKYWSCPCQPVIYVLHPAVCCCPQVEETILCWFPTIRWLPKRNPKTEKKHKTFSSSSRSTVTQCPGRKWALHFTHRLEVLYNHSLYEFDQLNSSISCDICWRVCVTVYIFWVCFHKLKATLCGCLLQDTSFPDTKLLGLFLVVNMYVTLWFYPITEDT